jgi:DNA polymerase alpha subunit A
VKYSAEHGAPSGDACDGGGRYFERIFGGHTPVLESFIIKRKLMGPSWLRIKRPQRCQGSTTHCKVRHDGGT